MANELHSNGDMRVGISIARSGALSKMGIQALKGIRLWISRLQNAGGLRVGDQLRSVRLIARDDGSRTSLVRDNTTLLLTEDGADLLFGPYSSHLTKAASEISEAHQRLLWNHGGASDEIFRDQPHWIVSTISPARRYFQKLPEWIAANDGGVDQYLVLCSSKGTFASDITAGLRETADLLTRPVHLNCAELPDSPEALLALLDQTLPQVLVLAGSFEQEIPLLRTRPAWPKSVRYAACVAAGIREFYNALGHLSENVIGPSQWEPGPGREPAAGPSSSEFLRDFIESFGEMPEYTAAGAFAAGLIAELCIRTAGSLADGRVREVAHDLDTNTFYGRFRIDPLGRQTGHEVRLVRWSGDKKIVIA